MRVAVAICFVLSLSACASAPSTPYRAPQATINGTTTEAVKMQLVQRCVSNGGSVEENTAYQLVCSKPMDSSFGSMMYRALATPSNSTNPEMKVRYSFVENAGQVFVSLDMFLQNQTAFGRVDRVPITNGDLAAQAQGMLNQLKSTFEGPRQPDQGLGTTPFPNASKQNEDCVSCANMRVR